MSRYDIDSKTVHNSPIEVIVFTRFDAASDDTDVDTVTGCLSQFWIDFQNVTHHTTEGRTSWHL